MRGAQQHRGPHGAAGLAQAEPQSGHLILTPQGHTWHGCAVVGHLLPLRQPSTPVQNTWRGGKSSFDFGHFSFPRQVPPQELRASRNRAVTVLGWLTSSMALFWHRSRSTAGARQVKNGPSPSLPADDRSGLGGCEGAGSQAGSQPPRALPSSSSHILPAAGAALSSHTATLRGWRRWQGAGEADGCHSLVAPQAQLPAASAGSGHRGDQAAQHRVTVLGSCGHSSQLWEAAATSGSRKKKKSKSHC